MAQTEPASDLSALAAEGGEQLIGCDRCGAARRAPCEWGNPSGKGPRGILYHRSRSTAWRRALADAAAPGNAESQMRRGAGAGAPMGTDGLIVRTSEIADWSARLATHVAGCQECGGLLCNEGRTLFRRVRRRSAALFHDYKDTDPALTGSTEAAGAVERLAEIAAAVADELRDNADS